MSMSTSTEVIAHHWAFAIFLIVAIGLCCLMLVGGWFLGGRARARGTKTFRLNQVSTRSAPPAYACLPSFTW
ncbi:NADH dehydrogenase I chain A [Salmonella enterica subsp. arizonae]|uniref:NADH dehydrogenase I chain A n=1 Tax=Salmonella enterica subsp. arizonae TaxID=59203 RepID=A0A379T9F5_SALER|nr:NADH dehydrogenase I chain A [Salmonella enterica subsp. arizonae]